MNTNKRLIEATGAIAPGSTRIGQLFRFLQIPRRKLPILIVCTILGTTIGSIWCMTAIRRFESFSEITVLKAEGNGLDQSLQSNPQSIQNFIPTFQNAITSDRVLEGVIARLPEVHRIDLKGIPKSRWTAALKRNMSISSIGLTNRILIRYASRNPRTARFVVDAIVKSYIDYRGKTQIGHNKESFALLNREKVQIETSIQDKETELLKRKRECGMLLDGNNQDTHPIIENTVQLNEALIEAQKKTLESRALLVSLQGALDAGMDIQPYVPQVTGENFRDFLLPGIVSGVNDVVSFGIGQEELRTDQTELRIDSLSLSPNLRQIRELDEQINPSKKWGSERSRPISSTMKGNQDQDLGPNLLATVRQQLVESNATEAAIREKFEFFREQALSLNGQVAQIAIAEMDLKRMRLYYNLILEQMRKTDHSTSTGLRIRVTSIAKVMPTAVAAKIWPTVLLCTFFGFMSGLGMVYAIDLRDDRFRSLDELRSQLDLPILATIHQMGPISGTGLDSVVTFASPESIESRSFRTLRHTMTISADRTQRLLITSSEPGDGTTTTVVNLAVAFAEAKKKTLVIDGDLRQSGLTQLLDLNGTRGLSQILGDSSPVSESCLENIFNIGVENLDVLPSGPRPSNPLKLLASDRFDDILAWAESAYDQILIDTPPVLAVEDAELIGRRMDGAIVVVRPDTNRRKTVLRGIDSFQRSGVEVLGIVANHIATCSGYDSDIGDCYGEDHHNYEVDVIETNDAYNAEPQIAA